MPTPSSPLPHLQVEHLVARKRFTLTNDQKKLLASLGVDEGGTDQPSGGAAGPGARREPEPAVVGVGRNARAASPATSAASSGGGKGGGGGGGGGTQQPQNASKLGDVSRGGPSPTTLQQPGKQQQQKGAKDGPGGGKDSGDGGSKGGAVEGRKKNSKDPISMPSLPGGKQQQQQRLIPGMEPAEPPKGGKQQQSGKQQQQQQQRFIPGMEPAEPPQGGKQQQRKPHLPGPPSASAVPSSAPSAAGGTSDVTRSPARPTAPVLRPAPAGPEGQEVEEEHAFPEGDFWDEDSSAEPMHDSQAQEAGGYYDAEANVGGQWGVANDSLPDGWQDGGHAVDGAEGRWSEEPQHADKVNHQGGGDNGWDAQPPYQPPRQMSGSGKIAPSGLPAVPYFAGDHSNAFFASSLPPLGDGGGPFAGGPYAAGGNGGSIGGGSFFPPAGDVGGPFSVSPAGNFPPQQGIGLPPMQQLQQQQQPGVAVRPHLLPPHLAGTLRPLGLPAVGLPVMGLPVHPHMVPLHVQQQQQFIPPPLHEAEKPRGDEDEDDMHDMLGMLGVTAPTPVAAPVVNSPLAPPPMQHYPQHMMAPLQQPLVPQGPLSFVGTGGGSAGVPSGLPPHLQQQQQQRPGPSNSRSLPLPVGAPLHLPGHPGGALASGSPGTVAAMSAMQYQHQQQQDMRQQQQHDWQDPLDSAEERGPKAAAGGEGIPGTAWAVKTHAKGGRGRAVREEDYEPGPDGFPGIADDGDYPDLGTAAKARPPSKGGAAGSAWSRGAPSSLVPPPGEDEEDEDLKKATEMSLKDTQSGGGRQYSGSSSATATGGGYFPGGGSGATSAPQVSATGLVNRQGDYNCFLNVIIQV